MCRKELIPQWRTGANARFWGSSRFGCSEAVGRIRRLGVECRHLNYEGSRAGRRAGAPRQALPYARLAKARELERASNSRTNPHATVSALDNWLCVTNESS